MHERQRMPGLSIGQIYTYPSKRWKKKRRQYLLNNCNGSSINSSIFNPGRRKESGKIIATYKTVPIQLYFLISHC